MAISEVIEYFWLRSTGGNVRTARFGTDSTNNNQSCGPLQIWLKNKGNWKLQTLRMNDNKDFSESKFFSTV
jgi:hypothetical protein